MEYKEQDASPSDHGVCFLAQSFLLVGHSFAFLIVGECIALEVRRYCRWYLSIIIMLRSFTRLMALAAAIVPQVLAAGPTDSYTDADPAQSGYLPNHNMDPAVVESSSFGLLWSKQYNAKELVSRTVVTSIC